MNFHATVLNFKSKHRHNCLFLFIYVVEFKTIMKMSAFTFETFYKETLFIKRFVENAKKFPFS